MDKLILHLSMCTRVIMPYKYSHWGRLSLLRFDELQVHFDVIFIRSVRRVRSDEDHVCFNFTNVQSVCTRTHFVIALFEWAR